jgi:hypothetical protein
MRIGRMFAAAAFAVVLGGPHGVWADDTIVVAGPVTWITQDAIEVGGRRGLINSQTAIMSDGHPISVTSISRGVMAELELDASGHALEIDVHGVRE